MQMFVFSVVLIVHGLSHYCYSAACLNSPYMQRVQSTSGNKVRYSSVSEIIGQLDWHIHLQNNTAEPPSFVK